MPHHHYRPDLMGSAAVSPSGTFEAGSTHPFALVYTCGRFGIDDRGSLKVAFRAHTDQSPLQTADPSAPGFVSVTTEPAVPIDVKVESRRNIRPWTQSLYVQCKRFLSEGDRVVVRFGETGISPGLRLQTFCEDTFEFRVFVDPFATYDMIALPDAEQPVIAIGPGAPVAWKIVAPTLRRPGEPFFIGVKREDRWGNPAPGDDGTALLCVSPDVPGFPRPIELGAADCAMEIGGLAIAAPGTYRFVLKDASGAGLARSNSVKIAAGERAHFWSDLHGQSEETVGTNSCRDYFAFARDRAFLDIAAHQGNDFQISDAFWAEINALTADFNEPGRFVTLPGYEWSGNTSVGGDHNVWYRHEGRPIYRSSRALVSDTSRPETDAHDATALFERLAGEEAIVTAHIGGRYADIGFAHDAKLEPSVEVHSAWGSFEWLLDDAFSRGYRVGVVAASDGHKGRPGASYPGDAEFGSYGGLTCHLLERLDRDALFKAFRKRHHYATTGARIGLDLAVMFDGPSTVSGRNPSLAGAPSCAARRAMMGDIVETDAATARVTFEVLGSAPIERVELRDGMHVVKTFRPYGEAELGGRIRIVCEGAAYRGRGRLVKWTAEAAVEGASISRIAGVNFWNPDIQPEQSGARTARWRCVTTGGFSAVDLWLAEEEADGKLAIGTSEGNAELSLADIGFADTVFDFGGLGKRIRVFRLPDANLPETLHGEADVNLAAERDTVLMIALTQCDGHRAWSSPVYVARR